MDALICEELLRAGRIKHLSVSMRVPPLRKSLEKPVFRIRNRLGAIPQTVDLSVFQRQRSNSSPRKSHFQTVRRPTVSPGKKAEPLSAQKAVTDLRRRSFVKYLDEACSDEEQREMQESPPLPTPVPPPPGKESPHYRTPSVESSNRPASIISLGPRRALYTCDSLDTPYEEKESPSPSRSSPKSAFKPPPRPTELSVLNLRASEDLYLFRKAPATRLPARRLRKLTGGKSGSSRTGSWKAETWTVSSFLYPMSENEARTSQYSKLQQPQLRISPRARRDKVSASLNSAVTVRVTTVLPSPQTLLEQ